MPATIQDLQKSLIEAITPELAAIGFTYKPKVRSFHRPIEGGRQSLHLGFINHKEDFDVTADVAVRNDAIEDLVNETRQLTAAAKALTATVGAELGNISVGQPRRWKVASEADIGRAVRGIMDDFRTTGIPYLERFSSLEEILSALSGDEPANRLHAPLHADRARKALAAAYLLGRKDEFNSLIEAKTRYLTERNDFGLDNFKAFAESLQIRDQASTIRNQ